MMHDMICTGRNSLGYSVWECPACGRTLWLKFPPDYDKRVIVEGDSGVCHAGSAAPPGVTFRINAAVETRTEGEPQP